VGAPAALPETGALFVNKDIIAAVEEKLESSPEISVQDAVSRVKDDVMKKFLDINPNLKLQPDNSVYIKMKRLHDSFLNFKQKRMTARQSKVFTEKLPKLFDCIACQCEIVNCGGGLACRSPVDCTGFHVLCSCEEKIPDKEVSFIKDQREKIGLLGGNMSMDRVDIKAVKIQEEEDKQEEKNEAKAKRKAEEAARVEDNLKKRKAEEIESKKERFVEALIAEDGSEEEVEEYTPVDDGEPTTQFTLPLTMFAAELCRYSVSERAGAALWNAIMYTLETAGRLRKTGNGSISEDLTADRHKIKRAMAKFGAVQQDAQKMRVEATGGLECIGTDGKRNKKTRLKTTAVVNGETIEKFSLGTEEHIVYTQEPGGDYLCHTAPKDGTGRGLAIDFGEVLAETKSKESLKCVSCDGTPVNTGWKDGLVAHLERDLGKKLLCLSCLLHQNELPLRKLFNESDGGFGTTGPESFGGEIGKLCSKPLHLEDVTAFEKVPSTLEDIEDEVVKTLSRDQNLLYKYIKAIQTGTVPSRLAPQKAGPLNHSRWLTLAIRLLQLYTRTKHPTEGLKTTVKYIMQVYGPCWFLIKRKVKFTNGPSLLFTQMRLIRTQAGEVQDIVIPVVQRNAFMADPGIMLCAMLESDSARTRKRAVEIIKDLRQKPPKKPRMKKLRGIRARKVPILQWSASSWVNIIDWKNAEVHEPFIIECPTDEDLETALKEPHEFPFFPVHT
jgi:hypothetical protein